ncbi:hypothetical protein FB451DRAFT_62866 [Mycena latifolia]|nr:hypothetical protein FB451DRAFT_62866 [Mycena latifolia]
MKANIHSLIALCGLLGVGILLLSVAQDPFALPSTSKSVLERYRRPSASVDLPANFRTPTGVELPANGVVPANVDILAPDLYPEQKYEWITENQKAAHGLFRCLEHENCAQNQTKVVIIASVNFRIPLQRGYIGGEAIWAMSTFRALKNMGYTVLFTLDMDSSFQLYHIFANLVKMVIANPEDATRCFNQTTCIRSAENPAGIPAWKIFSFLWWPYSVNPLGAKWTLHPEDYQHNGQALNTYLGYTIEPQCSKYPFVPHSQREPQVYILAKFLKFFLPANRAWPPEFFDAATNATGMSFVMASKDQAGSPKLSPGDLATSITNVGPVTQDQFYDLLSKSVALVGVGNPALSPTPYDAMCLGVPFINPVSGWDKKNPTDRSKWATQHNMLRSLSPPYVYHCIQGRPRRVCERDQGRRSESDRKLCTRAHEDDFG